MQVPVALHLPLTPPTVHLTFLLLNSFCPQVRFNRVPIHLLFLVQVPVDGPQTAVFLLKWQSVLQHVSKAKGGTATAGSQVSPTSRIPLPQTGRTEIDEVPELDGVLEAVCDGVPVADPVRAPPDEVGMTACPDEVGTTACPDEVGTAAAPDEVGTTACPDEVGTATPPDEVAPAAPDEVAPAAPDEVAPAAPDEVAAAPGSDEVAAAGSDEVAPAAGSDEVGAAGSDEVAPGSDEVAPGSDEVAPGSDEVCE